ncbi:MAG: NADH-quinone oxidoreductase subunit NuoH [Bacteroidota bacterium]|nr:NADH-quinone oxidoreductase subunit NuoH [Bacteroidota bacterium]MDP4234104.1 NADH-quinone oxidoreductase subunit NuoH [Bacteroidota bacterium]MDP4243045.1 NADH-quinone oxidoreductase subunit NuoH [Bacteroidota bacterium]MDP4287471.1 NADH-quinone oxidoreductase subunit NuoH [Bacteroidota bacterium]
MIIEALIKIAVILLVVLTAVSYTVLLERWVCAWVQDRIGPNRVGPFGLFQPLADVLKLLLKEDIEPLMAQGWFHWVAPVISITVAFTVLAVVPFGHTLAIGERIIPLTIASNINIGVLFIVAMTSVGVYGITLAGWSSGSKYSLLGGLRSSAQMISYELTLGLGLLSVVMLSGTLDLNGIIDSQVNGLWNIVRAPIGFLLFLVSSFAETNRQPFDLPEAEPELVGGYHTEYSSMKFALFFLSEYANIITASAVMTVLFLGGWHVPFVDSLGLSPLVMTIVGVLAFILKVVGLLFVFIWVRWSIPRFRYDQLMDLGWKVLLPLGIVNIILTALEKMYLMH